MQTSKRVSAKPLEISQAVPPSPSQGEAFPRGSPPPSHPPKRIVFHGAAQAAPCYCCKSRSRTRQPYPHCLRQTESPEHWPGQDSPWPSETLASSEAGALSGQHRGRELPTDKGEREPAPGQHRIIRSQLVLVGLYKGPAIYKLFKSSLCSPVLETRQMHCAL